MPPPTSPQLIHRKGPHRAGQDGGAEGMEERCWPRKPAGGGLGRVGERRQYLTRYRLQLDWGKQKGPKRGPRAEVLEVEVRSTPKKSNLALTLQKKSPQGFRFPGPRMEDRKGRDGPVIPTRRAWAPNPDKKLTRRS